MKFLKKIIRPKGFSYVLGIVIMLVVIMLGIAIAEVVRINIQAAAIRNKYEDAIIAMCVDNYTQLYQPVREGYAASYGNKGSGWSENNKANKEYIKSYLQTAMSSGEISQCDILDIDFTVTSAGLKNKTQTFAINGTINVSMPFDFLWGNITPITLELNVKSKWRAKF